MFDEKQRNKTSRTKFIRMSFSIVIVEERFFNKIITIFATFPLQFNAAFLLPPDYLQSWNRPDWWFRIR
jgi:hypothetical protein